MSDAPWDLFLEEHGGEMADVPLRAALQMFYEYVHARGLLREPDESSEETPAGGDGRDETAMRPAVLITWIESEAGWGQRPDGASLHLTQEDADAYVRAYWDSMPPRDENGMAPSLYWRPTSAGTTVLVDGQLAGRLEEAREERGVRIGEMKYREMHRAGRIRETP